ncbi:hypothetical protein [Bradyrhizobium sp.]|uniref:hypothetical protein n=1 Tax=Bradyrhizobium sp. TaxID=376 RepID=UPI0026170129|nr:hypothetical protein [Bradyrhizobium sp.]
MPVAARRSTRKTPSGIRLPRVDARTRTSRRYLELVQTFEREIGGQLTETDRVLVKQAASITIRAEQLEAAIVAGQSVDSDELIRLTSECRRILATLKGSAEKNKPAVPSLQDYIASKYGAGAAAGGDA